MIWSDFETFDLSNFELEILVQILGTAYYLLKFRLKL